MLKQTKELIHTFIPNRFNYIQGRRVGNTTRQVDLAIQLLFEGKVVQCKDHYVSTERGELVDNATRDRLAKDMLKKVLRRLDMEHGEIVRRNKVKIDHKNNSIELIDL